MGRVHVQMGARVTSIAHLSDLHFGAASPVAVDALLSDLSETAPDIIVITGDLTQEGRRKEFEAAKSFLRNLPAPFLVVPGNHDVPVRNLWARFADPYNRFERYVEGAIDPVFKNDNIVVVGLNSARRAALSMNWSFGRLSNRQIRNAAAQLDDAPKEAVKIVAVHHPFVKGPGRAGSRIVGRGGEAMAAFVESGLDMTLTGHVHHSNAHVLPVADRGVVVAQAGTATSLRTRGEPPSYHRINASAGAITVRTRTLEGNSFTESGLAGFAYEKEQGWRLTGSET
jgi:3',5'-cyclic AMP phosphodiesterase CpdA